MKNQDSTESGDLMEFPFDKIKFCATRADNDSGEQIVGSLTHIVNSGLFHEYYIIESDGMKTRVIPETICMFTGFKDHFGNDIYTGDVISYKWSYIGSSDKFDRLVDVIFDDVGYCIYVSDVNGNSLYDFLHDQHISDAKVIGHLHQGNTDLCMDEYMYWLEYTDSYEYDQFDINKCINSIAESGKKYLESRRMCEYDNV